MKASVDKNVMESQLAKLVSIQYSVVVHLVSKETQLFFVNFS